MRTKFTATIIALIAMLAFVAGPAQAQDADEVDEIEEEVEEVEEVENEEVENESDDDGEGLGQVRSAAARAKSAAQDLEDGTADDDLEAMNENAKAALEAVVDRLSVEGSGGSGVAADVLTALIAGDSPSDLGAAHGAEMAQAAADRRAERAEAGHGRPNDAGAPEGTGRPEGAGRP